MNTLRATLNNSSLANGITVIVFAATIAAVLMVTIGTSKNRRKESKATDFEPSK